MTVFGSCMVALIGAGLAQGGQNAYSSGYVPTYYVDVQPILEQHCVTCHREGGIAPFSLETGEDAVARAALIAAVTKRGAMPPFPPSEDSQPFLNERKLGAASKQVLEDWASAGAPLGKPLPGQKR